MKSLHKTISILEERHPGRRFDFECIYFDREYKITVDGKTKIFDIPEDFWFPADIADLVERRFDL
jgi:hypothetical protein